MTEPITHFTGKYRFLSNFYPSLIEDEGYSYLSVEHAYQAAKAVSADDKMSISQLISPGQTKRYDRKIKMRSDWDDIKLAVMEKYLLQKFAPGKTLYEMLRLTGDAELIEGNDWGDTYWGQCPVGEGFNHLGRLLMKIRDEDV